MRTPELATRADVMERLTVLSNTGPAVEDCPSILLPFWSAYRRAAENVLGDTAGTAGMDTALDSVMVAIDQSEAALRDVDIDKGGPTQALQKLGSWRGYIAASECFR